MAAVPPLAVETYTIYEFANKYLELLLGHDGTPAGIEEQESLAAEFALTGYLRETNQQANLNALENPFNRVETASQLRDYDSLLGFVPGPIELHCEIWVHPIPNPAHTLTSNVHIKVPFRLPDQVSPLCSYCHVCWPLTPVLPHSSLSLPSPTAAFLGGPLPPAFLSPHPSSLFRGQPEQMQDTQMSPHLIPNMVLADLPGKHSILRVFFPGLYSGEGDVHLDLGQHAAVYANLRRAMAFVDYAGSLRWSPSYHSAVSKAVKGNSRILQWTSYAVAPRYTNEFLRAFEGYLMDECDWAHGLVYQVQVQGVKDLYQHAGFDPIDAEEQLERLLEPFDTTVGDWWIDVGWEIVVPGAALQWRTSAHGTVLAHVLKIPSETANGACHLSNHSYHRDMSAHLPSLSGYRVTLKRNQGGAAHSGYAQAYVSDKNLTYHKSTKGSGKQVTVHQVVQGKPPKVVVDLYELFVDASGSLSCSARLEHRVPLDTEGRVFSEPLPEWLLNASLLVFRMEEWWYVARLSSMHGQIYSHAVGI